MRITKIHGESAVNSNSLNDEEENDSCLFIEFYEKKILFDIGQSDRFIRNAEKMGIDLSQVDYLIITNSHSDPEGGLTHFLKINKKAKIFLHINAANKLYTRIFDMIPRYLIPFQKSIAQKSRIHFIDEDTQIDEKMILLEGFRGVFPQPEANKSLSAKDGNLFINNKLRDDIVMLLIENNEIVIFSGCTYAGIINLIEEVKLFSKTMKIMAVYITH
jgi:7,8-dihydropterin-6-yl-methyl-4-(beta-D-ribofuranosyl)aminobenzene 5'-phosphate synthase